MRYHFLKHAYHNVTLLAFLLLNYRNSYLAVLIITTFKFVLFIGSNPDMFYL